MLELDAADALYGADEVNREAARQAWRRGDLSWLLHDGNGDPSKGQLAARALTRNGKARRYVFAIARRWGKSWFFCVQACEVALSKPRSRIPYAAATATSLREFIIPIMRQIIETAPLDMRPVIIGNEVRFANESRIIMQGCEDQAKAEHLRGPAADLVVVDEAGFIPVLDYVVTSVLLFQLATTRGQMLIGSSPPETPAHPFTDFAKEAELKGAYMHATIYDAPQVTRDGIEEVMDACGGPDSIAWQREGLARFLVDPTRALVPEFTALEPELTVDFPTSAPDCVDRYIVGDLGFVDLTFVLFAVWDFRQAMLVIVDEWVEDRATTDVVQREVDAKARALWSDAPIHRRVIDASARARADMQRLQVDGDPTADNAWRMAKNQERDAAVNQLRLAIGRKQWRIHPRCEQLRAHLRNGVWNERKSDFARADGYGHYDGVAAAMYLERHVDRTHNPSPPAAWDRYSQIGPSPGSVETGSKAMRALRLKKAFAPKRKT